MQILYLSNRPTVMSETWRYVRHFMPWADRAVVVVPHAQLELMGLSADDRVTLVDESELTGLTPTQLGDLDHVRRNVTLRRRLLETDLVDDVFLLSDDDYRPIKPVAPELFTSDGLDVGYFSHDLDAWPGDETPFDWAQHVTAQVLGYLGAPRRAYGAHMPQIMRRELWDEAFATFDRLRDDPLVCEWAVYFNLAMTQHPDRFAPPRVYLTMCWPPYPHEWMLRVRPSEYVFENHYPYLYGPGQLFEGLPAVLDPATAERDAVEKLVRWSALGRRVARLEFDGAPIEPWTKDKAGRRLTFRVLWALRKAYEYVSITDRQGISELAGSVQAIEDRLDRLCADEHRDEPNPTELSDR